MEPVKLFPLANGSFPMHREPQAPTQLRSRQLRLPSSNRRRGDAGLGIVSCSKAVSATTEASSSGRFVIRCWILLSVIALALLLSGRVLGQEAQQYKSEAVRPQLLAREATRLMETARREGLIRNQPVSQQWDQFRYFVAYYRSYQFGKLKDAKYLSQYDEISKSIMLDYNRVLRDPPLPASAVIRELIVSEASRIAADNYHPLARVTATMMLAQLDQLPQRHNPPRPPVPSEEAYASLEQLYGSGRMPDGVRAAALLGILRHAKLDAIPENRRNGLGRAMMALVGSDPPEGRSPEAHAYMQRFAVDVLIQMADPNQSPRILQAIVSLANDREKPNLIAAYAAAKLGRLEGERAKVEQPDQLVKSWMARVADTIDREIDRIAKLEPPVAVKDQPSLSTIGTYAARGPGAGMGMGETDDYDGAMDAMNMDMGGDMDMGDMDMEYYGGAGMMGRGGAAAVNPQPLELVSSRRAINHVLEQLQFGSTGRRQTGMPPSPKGLLAAVGQDQRAAVESWIAKITELVTEINDETLDDRKKFIEVLQAQSSQLKELAGVDSAEQSIPLPADIDPEADGPGAVGPDGERPAVDPMDDFAEGPAAAEGGEAPPGAEMPSDPSQPGVQPGAPQAAQPGAVEPEAPAGAQPDGQPAPVVPDGGEDFSF